ncbi:restriction endonuclease subunit S [uncultured Clostridium sp.]|uniref:restriction endonuclease subunit S n=1 Tax=uncultured Clostridium sp. TaxID=59620 RepID=UPI0025F49732|nr:restriction endonuclease subunit S [uncultured Clostridium sp.]
MKKIREGYKMTEFGQIPNSWMVKTIGEIFEFSGGLSISRAMLTDKGVNYLHYGDIHMRNENYIDTKKDEEWLPKLEDNFEGIKDNVKLNTGDIVFADASEDYEGIGKSVVIFNELKRPFVSGLHTIVAKDINNELDNSYKRYCFSTNEVRKQFRQLAVGTSVYGISRENIKKIKINIPTLEEQEKISLILSTVDEQIDNVDELIEKNKKLKKGLMQQLLTKGIGHTKFKKTEIGEIPEPWEVKKFFEFVEKVIDFRGRTPKKLGMDWGNGDIQALSANNVKMGKIDFSLECYLASIELYEKWMNGNELSKDDILMTMEAPLGNIALVPDERRYILSQRVIALKTKDIIVNKFMKYLLMSDIVQSQLDTLSTGTTAKGINQKNLAKVMVLIPSIEEQEKIASILSKVDEKIEEYEYKKQKLEELKKGLMQQLLSGKVRVV